MTIYLDMRAGSAELLSHIQPRPSPMQLDSGDFMFVGNGLKGNVLVGGEVKKLGDALQCMQDGRLVTQLRKMLEDYDVLYFVLEARIRQNPKNGYLQQHLRRKNPKSKTGRMHEFWADAMFGAREHVMYEAFMSWLHLSIGFSVGVQVVHTGSNAETGAWISAQHRWYQKDWSEHKSLRVFDTSQRPSLAEPSRAAEVAHALADGSLRQAKRLGSRREVKKFRGPEKCFQVRQFHRGHGQLFNPRHSSDLCFNGGCSQWRYIDIYLNAIF